MEELERELEIPLEDLASRLLQIDAHELVVDILALLRRHSVRWQKMEAEAGGQFEFQHPVNLVPSLPKNAFVEMSMKRLLMSMQAHHRLTSDLIFVTVNKIVTYQVHLL